MKPTRDPTAAMVSALTCLLRSDPDGAADGLAQVSGWVMSCARNAAEQEAPSLVALTEKLAIAHKRADALLDENTKLQAKLAELSGHDEPVTPSQMFVALSEAFEMVRDMKTTLEAVRAPDRIAAVIDAAEQVKGLSHEAFCERIDAIWGLPAKEPEPVKPDCKHALCSKGMCARIDGHGGKCAFGMTGEKCGVCGLSITLDVESDEVPF